MAREITINIVCDGCPEGTAKHEADDIVRIGMEGAWRELDVCEAGKKNVRETVGAFMDKGHAYGSKSQKKKAAQTGLVTFSQPDPNRGLAGRRVAAYNRAVRVWAHRVGIQVSPRGQIPQPVLERYERENPVEAAELAAAAPV